MNQEKHLNSIYIPNHINEKITKLNNHFGTIVEETIYSSIKDHTQNISEENINILNNIYKNNEIKYLAINESLIEMKEIKKDRIAFWNNILESNQSDNLNVDGIKNIISIIEAQEKIEGDGEDPTTDNTNTGDTGDGEDANNGDIDSGDQPDSTELSPDQQLQIELAQTNNKFMAIILYDKIIELINTIESIQDSVSSSKTEEKLNFLEDLLMYKDYLNVLSELIFVMDLNTVYYNFTNISLEVNNLLDKYLVSTKIKILNNSKISKEEKTSIIDSLKDNLKNKLETDSKIQNEGIN